MNIRLTSIILAASLASACAQYTPPTIYKVEGYQVTTISDDGTLTNSQSIRQTPLELETYNIAHFDLHSDPSRIVVHSKYYRAQRTWDYWVPKMSEQLTYGPHRPGQRWLNVETNALSAWERAGTPGAVGKLRRYGGFKKQLVTFTISAVTFAVENNDSIYGYRVRFLWYCHTTNGELKLAETWRNVRPGQRVIYTPTVSELSTALGERVVFGRAGGTDSFCCYDFDAAWQ